MSRIRRTPAKSDCKIVELASSVSVCDVVFVAADGNGTQGGGEPGILSVELTVTGLDGKPVTDIFGNPVIGMTMAATPTRTFWFLKVVSRTRSRSSKFPGIGWLRANYTDAVRDSDAFRDDADDTFSGVRYSSSTVSGPRLCWGRPIPTLGAAQPGGHRSADNALRDHPVELRRRTTQATGVLSASPWSTRVIEVRPR